MFDVTTLLSEVRNRVRPPVVVVLGSPRPAADLVAALGTDEVVCYQMDLHQSNRLREELELSGLSARVETLPDLWDLPADFQTAIFPAAAQGERELKLDMLEQAYHVLRPRGLMVTLSEHTKDAVFARWHKKIFGRCSEAPASKAGSVFWGQREGDQPRRRHEQTFRAKLGDGPPMTFVSRPGVFSYGRFDDGARALLEVAGVQPGDRVLDLGCGVGAVGALASQRSGPEGSVTFLDSNLRAIALTELNARANNVPNFRTVATARMEGLDPEGYEIILANPPYYAQSAVARLFVEGSRNLLRPGGRFYLVTKQLADVAPMVVEAFGETLAHERRGYTVLEAGGARESIS